MEKVFLKQIETLGLDKKSIYLAISGGIDSMVLSFLLNQFKIKHTLLHCNFKLRGKDADKDEQFVIDYAKSNHLAYHTIQFNTEIEAKKRKQTIQECARELRYNWFNQFLNQENIVLLTAHHLDDAIETFFINILRGTGLKGLKGITNKPQILRPLLSFSKADIIDFAQTNNINFREDKSNLSDKYLRNDLRLNVIPQLKKIEPSWDIKMKQLFSELNEIDAFLDEQINDLQVILQKENKIKVSILNKLPSFLSIRLFSEFGATRKNYGEFMSVVNGNNGAVFKTSSYDFLKDNGYIILNKNEDKNEINLAFDYTKNNILKLESCRVMLNFSEVSPNEMVFKPNIAYVDISKLNGKIRVRNWQNGDKMNPLGLKGTKLLSDIFKDQKINQFDRKERLIITTDNDIVWIVNSTFSEKFKITPNTRRVLKIEYLKY